MRNSTRMRDAEKNGIFSLSRETYVQTNEGFRSGQKPEYVNCTSKDIVHAYHNVCLHCANVTGPVLILEDDACVLLKEKKVFERIDSFLKCKRYDFYTLGSFGIHDLRFRAGFHRKFAWYAGCSQATVWSQHSRMALLEAHLPGIRHIDTSFIRLFSGIFTYYKPVACQLLARTENTSSWSLLVDTHSKILKMLDGACILAGVRLTGLDRCYGGWFVAYWLNEHFIALVLAATLLAARPILFRRTKSRGVSVVLPGETRMYSECSPRSTGTCGRTRGSNSYLAHDDYPTLEPFGEEATSARGRDRPSSQSLRGDDPDLAHFTGKSVPHVHSGLHILGRGVVHEIGDHRTREEGQIQLHRYGIAFSPRTDEDGER